MCIVYCAHCAKLLWSRRSGTPSILLGFTPSLCTDSWHNPLMESQKLSVKPGEKMSHLKSPQHLHHLHLQQWDSNKWMYFQRWRKSHRFYLRQQSDNSGNRSSFLPGLLQWTRCWWLEWHVWIVQKDRGDERGPQCLHSDAWHKVSRHAEQTVQWWGSLEHYI